MLPTRYDNLPRGVDAAVVPSAAPLRPVEAPPIRAAKERSLARRCLRVALVTTAVYAAIVGAVAAAEGGPSWFLHLGRNHPALATAQRVLGPDVIVPHPDGHDGPYFWLLARDPMLGDRGLTTALDRPAYRAQRIGYPLVAAPWRLFGEQGLLWGLILTNLGAVFLGAWATTGLAVALGAPARAAWVWGANPAVMIAVGLDTGDALALALLVMSLWQLQRRRYAWAIAAGVGAVLTKEPSLLALGAVAVLWTGPPRRVRVSLAAVPTIAAGCWGLFARWRFGWPPSKIQEFTWPPQGWVEAWVRGWQPYALWTNAVIALIVAGIGVVVIRAWWRRRSFLLAAALPFAVLLPFLSGQVLELPHDLLRAVAPLLTFGGLELYRRDARSKAPA